MPTMDIFNRPEFSVSSLSGMIERVPYAPTLLGSLGIFTPMPVRTRNVMIERRDNRLTLIQSSADGAPPDALESDDRDLVMMRTTRLAKRFTLYAHELDGIRAFGSETELMAVQAEYARRAARIKADMSLTHEYHRLGALQGVLMDADGVSVIRDYFDEFEITRPAVIALDFRPTATGVKRRLQQLAREIIRSSGGALTEASEIHALVGDDAYDALVSHPEVERMYLNWSAAMDLGNRKIFDSFKYGGIVWHNYRGTDDNSTIAIPTNGARFFPVGAPEVFKKAMAPLESLGYIGTMGQDTYMMNIPDRERDMWTKGEIYSYPLYICQRPDLLRSATVQTT